MLQTIWPGQQCAIRPTAVTRGGSGSGRGNGIVDPKRRRCRNDERNLIEEMHEGQREMALAFVRATMELATRTANDPLTCAMQRAHDVLQHQPSSTG